MSPPPASPTTQRFLLLAVLAVALAGIAVTGACLIVAVGAGILNYRDDARDRAAAESDPRFQRPLVSTSGRILFVAQNNGTDDFYVVNADGSELTRLTHFPTGSLHPDPPIVSPDRTRLAVSMGGVLIVRLDRPGEPIRLNRPGGALAWSPDGTRLVSLSIDDQKRLHLYLFNADASGEIRDIAAAWPSTAAGDEQSVGNLAWSPDGKRFAFVLSTRPGYKRSGPRHRHMYFALADGSELKNVSVQPNALSVGGGFAWSPDGRRLAFEGGRGIAMVDADSRWSDIPIAIHGSRSSQQPAWSPDGTRLAWFNPDSIVISDPDGSRQQELTRGRCRGVHPSWADDGLRIAFVCHEGRSNVFVMNADGSGLTKITNLEADRSLLDPATNYHAKYPVWLPAPSPMARLSR